jgi:hypothetical protein
MTVAAHNKPFFITPVYGILLHGSPAMPIGLYHLYKASAAQLTRLHYSENSVKLIKSRLALLAEYGYVQFDERPTAQYRTPYYYMLGHRGIEYMKSLGVVVSSSYCPSKEVGQSYLHLLHHSGVNDILIAAAILKRQMPEYSLEHFTMEHELASEPFDILWQGKQYRIVPNLFLDLHQALPDGRQRRKPILVEHDQGTEQEEAIRRKIHAYSNMISSSWYKNRYGVNSITIAFTTFQGKRRRDELRAWARQELHSQDRSLATSFLFTTQQQPPDPKHLWLNPCWYTAYMDDKPVSILAGA